MSLERLALAKGDFGLIDGGLGLLEAGLGLSEAGFGNSGWTGPLQACLDCTKASVGGPSMSLRGWFKPLRG